MKKAWILGISLMFSPLASANWLKAMQAYELQNYPTAKAEFERLLPLGNADAVMNLGAMAYQGQGMPADPAQAMAYFMLAAELKSDRAPKLLAQIQQTATAEQLAHAEKLFLALQPQVKIKVFDKPAVQMNLDYPKPLKRQEPKYPLEAARNGQFGYVTLRFLVDEQGDVQTMDVIDSFPTGVFDKESKKALKKWKYESSPQKHVFRVRLDYSLDGGINVKVAEKRATELQLYQGALLGSPDHQYVLGTLLQLMDVQAGHRIDIDKTIPATASLDLSPFKPIKRPRLALTGFVGDVVVKVAPDGTILAQVAGEISPESQIKDLKGMKLQGTIEHDQYRIARSVRVEDKQLWVHAHVKAPETLSGMFWLERAAKNGSIEAQRVMAAYDQQWEEYLLSIKDGEAMAWVGTRFMLEGKQEQGIAMLKDAVAANYALAGELLEQFM